MEKTDVIIYLADIRNADAEKLYQQYGFAFEKERLMRISNCTNEKEKALLICTGVLLHAVMKRFEVTSDVIGYADKGKPYAVANTNFHFNISHSGAYVMIAISGQEVGADIQKPVPYKEMLVNKICSCDERSSIGDHLVKNLNYVWAVKESYTKLTGDGITMDLSDVTFTEENRNVFVSYKGEPKAEGIRLEIDDMYEAVVEAKESFKIKEFNRLAL